MTNAAMTTPTPTTSDLLLILAKRVESSMQPPARGAAAAATLREFAALPDLTDVAVTTLASAFLIVGTAREGDTPPVTARRSTCREFAHLLAPEVEWKAGDAVRAAALDLWAHFCHLPGEGPRYEAIRATANREHSDLVDACPPAVI